MRARFRDLGFAVGRVPTGPGNAITDVPGVRERPSRTRTVRYPRSAHEPAHALAHATATREPRGIPLTSRWFIHALALS